ncbi:MAG: TetR/AcrR family transcriptional regulator [Pseudomonadota bacterium]|nr:TetR/AcrR family transcriptional regulator [Pseudomonadota bacterium]
MTRTSFRERVLQVREAAIVDAVNRLLADKGFELMTVDAVAAEVGIAKASLYKHFASKEALAAAAMVRLLQQVQAVVEQQAARSEADAFTRLQAVTRWALSKQLVGEMPLLPAQNSSLRTELLADRSYLDLLMQVSETLGEWIHEAQAQGKIDPTLPPELVLYTLYARGCDPVPSVLKAGGRHSDEQIIDWVMRTCFNGLKGD